MKPTLRESLYGSAYERQSLTPQALRFDIDSQNPSPRTAMFSGATSTRFWRSVVCGGVATQRHMFRERHSERRWGAHITTIFASSARPSTQSRRRKHLKTLALAQSAIFEEPDRGVPLSLQIRAQRQLVEAALPHARITRLGTPHQQPLVAACRQAL